MSELLFGQSYYLRFDPKLYRAMQPYPPLGTLWAAACARAAGFSVSLFDAMLATDEHDWAAALDGARPRYAILFEDNFNYLSKMCLLRMRQAAFRMVDMARARGCRVIVCGSDATDRSAEYLRRGADFVVVGEGEATLVQLLTAQRQGAEVDAIAGLRFLDERGRVRDTGRRAVAADLDALPMPAWELVDLPRYAGIWRARHRRFSINMATTRGCPFHCNWCAKPIWGQTYHSRSPARVVEEMLLLRTQHGIEHVHFADDIMGLQPGWMGRFADALHDAELRLPFKCLSRADLLLRDGEIESLRRAGCETVWIGAESGSQAILDAMEKGITVAQIEEAAAALRAAGIRVGFFLQFGYPGERRADIDRTRALVRRSRPDEIGMSVSYPLPGTPFHERVRHELGARHNWVDSEDLAMLYDGPYGTAFYRQLHRVVQLEFRRQRAAETLGAAAGAAAGAGAGANGRLGPVRRARAAAALLTHSLRLPVERLRLRFRQRPAADPTRLRAAALPREDAATPSPQA